MKKSYIVCIACVFSLLFPIKSFSQNTTVALKTPIVVTSCGQSPGALMIRMIAQKAQLECDQKNTLSVDELKQKPYKTLIITMGTSLKGMGAAGTDIKREIKRIQGLVEEAKKSGITVVGAHIEGMARRTDESDAMSCDAVSAVSQAFFVKEESNQDGYFTKISNDKKIPLYAAKQPLDFVDTFKELFK